MYMVFYSNARMVSMNGIKFISKVKASFTAICLQGAEYEAD